MIEFPKVGEGVETELAENMVFSMHPHAIAANGEDCLYMQDTWLVTAEGGVPLARLPMQVFRAAAASLRGAQRLRSGIRARASALRQLHLDCT